MAGVQWMCTINFKTLDTIIIAQTIESWGWQRQRWAGEPFCTARATRRLALRYGRQGNICKSPHDRAAFFSLSLSCTSKVIGVDVWSLSCYGPGHQIASHFFATRHPKEKDARDKFVFLCIYMVNITYIYDRENWWMLTSESSGWHFVGGSLKAPCSCRRRNFIILGGRNGVEKCRVAIKMSFFSSYYEPFFCNK